MNMESKTSIFGVNITTSSKESILSSISRRLTVSRFSCFLIVTPNQEQVVLAQKNKTFRNILNEADISLPDGVGLKLANVKITDVKKQITHSIPGREFMIDLCRLCSQKNKRVLLYGGKGGVAEAALEELKKNIPNLDGLAVAGPELSESDVLDPAVVTELCQIIRSRNISIVFFGFGAPKQEYLMHAVKERFQDTTPRGIERTIVLMTVGGSFDVFAGKVRHTPKVVQQLGFEWLWRLIQEPWRWKRQLALFMFLHLVFTKKIRDN